MVRSYVGTNHQAGRCKHSLAARVDVDEAIAAVLSAIRRLMSPLASKSQGIGFTAKID